LEFLLPKTTLLFNEISAFVKFIKRKRNSKEKKIKSKQQKIQKKKKKIKN